MAKILSFIILLLLTCSGYSQRERVFLDFDKYTCKAGDTVWFKGHIFRLKVEGFSYTGKVIHYETVISP